jgi:hypothetical protein
MGSRSSVKVTFKGKEYAGEYEVEGSAVRVFFDGKIKVGRNTSSDPEFLARLLLIELVSRV